jgi:NADH-quinone oxidoreductase subunit M
LFNYSYPFFAIIGGIGIVLSAAYMLRLIKNTLFGPVPEGRAGIHLSAFEGATAVPIIALILYFGLHPAPILKSFEQEQKPSAEILIIESIQQNDTDDDFEEFEKFEEFEEFDDD